jgi:hypothetical protein
MFITKHELIVGTYIHFSDGNLVVYDETWRERLLVYEREKRVWASAHQRAERWRRKKSMRYVCGPCAAIRTSRRAGPCTHIYVDRDCCGGPDHFEEHWKEIHVRLNIWHFMRRIARGCSSEYVRPMLEWDSVTRLAEARKKELGQGLSMRWDDWPNRRPVDEIQRRRWAWGAWGPSDRLESDADHL